MNSYLMSMCTASCSLYLTTMGDISDSLSGHFIWKYELISDVNVHFILFTSSDNYGRYIWHLIWTFHLKIWTHFLISGLVLSVHFIWALHLKLGGTSYLDTSSENMNSFWVLLLLQRGLFYKRPIRTKRSIYMHLFILILFVVVVVLLVVVVHV